MSAGNEITTRVAFTLQLPLTAKRTGAVRIVKSSDRTAYPCTTLERTEVVTHTQLKALDPSQRRIDPGYKSPWRAFRHLSHAPKNIAEFTPTGEHFANFGSRLNDPKPFERVRESFFEDRKGTVYHGK